MSTNTTRRPRSSLSRGDEARTPTSPRPSSSGARNSCATCSSSADAKFRTSAPPWPSTVEREHLSICEEIRPYDTTDDHRRASGDGVPAEEREGRAPRKSDFRTRGEARDVQGYRRL